MKVRDLLNYASSHQEQPAYIQLDRNRDGQLDHKGWSFHLFKSVLNEHFYRSTDSF